MECVMNYDGGFCRVLCLEQKEQRMSFSLISNEIPIKGKEGKSHRALLNSLS